MNDQRLMAGNSTKKTKLISRDIDEIRAEINEASRGAEARAALKKAEIEVLEHLLAQQRARLRFVSAIAVLALVLALVSLLLFAP